MLTIEQGQIVEYTGPRECTVLQLPDQYLLKNCRLPYILANQTKPMKGSIVLVASLDAYKSYIIAVLRDPIGFLETGEGIRGSDEENELDLPAGEIYMESTGSSDPDSAVSGSGSSLHIGNDGTITLSSGQLKEFLILGGQDSDDDGEVILTGDNGYLEGNIQEVTPILGVRSTFSFDEENNLKVGNYRYPLPLTGTVEPPGVPASELTMTRTGEIILRNTSLLGTDLSNLTMDTVGNTTLKATTINLNNGSFGAARLNDATLINSTTDSTFLAYMAALDAFMSQVYTMFNSHTHLYSPGPGGPTPTATPLPIISTTPPSHPSTVTGKINAASSTVKIGD